VRQDEYLQNDLLSSLLEYVHSGENCKLILIGDTAQLPPIGSEDSPALNPDFLRSRYACEIILRELTIVERQKEDSGILYNATKLRISLLEPEFVLPKIEQTSDCFNVMGESLEDQLNQAYSQYGMENVLIVTRSNKRANLYNKNIRSRIQLFEEDINTGDNLMVVKNNYYWLNDIGRKGDFIANGDMMEISKIIRREKLYGFEFADCLLRFSDLDEKEIEAKLILESLYQDQASMSNDSISLLQQEVLLDVEELTDNALKFGYLKKSPHYNALQVKFSYAITCHKAQGGQWPCVFIDHGYLSDEMMDKSFIRWLYTAITRATEQVYLVNFNQKLIQ
ncbi:MAG: ATP-dependent helicase, partial [Flavobacteriales bacterium]|nr:ATP-dependent helicase [Flavobacteriales bacterium]